MMKFQSTLPRRERPIGGNHAVLVNNFNPRSREGSDSSIELMHEWFVISIHAPAKGATPV